jgi:predicted nucleic acid binding AN1-type Zn finger protein
MNINPPHNDNVNIFNNKINLSSIIKPIIESENKLNNNTQKIDISEKLVNKKKNRCPVKNCSKKLKLTDTLCRCQLKFCGKHRLPENHSCDFDFKTTGKDQLKKENEVITTSKIDKI